MYWHVALDAMQLGVDGVHSGQVAGLAPSPRAGAH